MKNIKRLISEEKTNLKLFFSNNEDDTKWFEEDFSEEEYRSLHQNKTLEEFLRNYIKVVSRGDEERCRAIKAIFATASFDVYPLDSESETYDLQNLKTETVEVAGISLPATLKAVSAFDKIKAEESIISVEVGIYNIHYGNIEFGEIELTI